MVLGSLSIGDHFCFCFIMVTKSHRRKLTTANPTQLEKKKKTRSFYHSHNVPSSLGRKMRLIRIRNSSVYKLIEVENYISDWPISMTEEVTSKEFQ